LPNTPTAWNAGRSKEGRFLLQMQIRLAKPLAAVSEIAMNEVVCADGLSAAVEGPPLAIAARGLVKRFGEVRAGARCAGGADGGAGAGDPLDLPEAVAARLGPASMRQARNA
jgi:hypothetical protein